MGEAEPAPGVGPIGALGLVAHRCVQLAPRPNSATCSAARGGRLASPYPSRDGTGTRHRRTPRRHRALPPRPAGATARAGGRSEGGPLVRGPSGLRGALRRDRWGGRPAVVVEVLELLTACAELGPDEPVRFHHLPGTRGLMVLRTFELWTHGDDIRQAVGRPLDLLDEGRLSMMVSELMSALPSGPRSRAGLSRSHGTLSAQRSGWGDLRRAARLR